MICWKPVWVAPYTPSALLLLPTSILMSSLGGQKKRRSGREELAGDLAGPGPMRKLRLPELGVWTGPESWACRKGWLVGRSRVALAP